MSEAIKMCNDIMIPCVYCDVSIDAAGEPCFELIEIPQRVWRGELKKIVDFVRRHGWTAIPADGKKPDGNWMYACPVCVRRQLFGDAQ